MADRPQDKRGSKSQEPTYPGFAARQAALHLLRGVLHDRTQMSDMLGSDGPLHVLSPADRARAQRLATATLRHLSQADTVIGQFVERLPPDEALNVLRLATVELCVEESAAHGVVDSAVTLMRRNRHSRKMAGLANAVLRKVSTEGKEMWGDLPAPASPKWLRRRVVHIYNEEIVQAIEAAHVTVAPLDITPKDPTEAVDLAEKLGGELLPTGSIRLKRAGQVSALEGYEAGEWWVQDAAAALPVKLLAPEKGEQILDICAAPGGKTMQLAASGAEVTAIEMNRKRIGRVEENLRRTGLDAELIHADVLEWEAEQFYDAILLDAPCSATGTIRRHPDLPFVKNFKELDTLFALQAEMIDRALIALRPGGRLVFCTCSLLAEECEQQAKTAIARHGLTEIKPDPKKLGIDPAWLHPNGGIRLRPDFWSDRGGMDGFFMIALRKPE